MDGHIGGAAIDVYPWEPEKNGDRFQNPLQDLPNVILTPHIGGSTEEAQQNIGEDVSIKLFQLPGKRHHLRFSYRTCIGIAAAGRYSPHIAYS